MSGFDLQRLGQIMEPEPGNPMEAEGVLNPAAVRGPDGELYLFPRLVAQGNYSRIDVYYGMPTTGSAWRGLTSRNTCRQTPAPMAMDQRPRRKNER
jgi:hypothetical protein